MTVADDRCLITRGTYRKVKWEIQEFQFVTDFMLLPLKGCDLVLGVQWLLSLRSIS